MMAQHRGKQHGGIERCLSVIGCQRLCIHRCFGGHDVLVCRPCMLVDLAAIVGPVCQLSMDPTTAQASVYPRSMYTTALQQHTLVMQQSVYQLTFMRLSVVVFIVSAVLSQQAPCFRADFLVTSHDCSVLMYVQYFAVLIATRVGQCCGFMATIQILQVPLLLESTVSR